MDISKESAQWLQVRRYFHNNGISIKLDPRPTSSIGYFETGNAEIISDEGSVQIRQGNLVFVPRGASYTIRYSEDAIGYTVAHFNFPVNTGCFSGKIIPIQSFPGSREAFDLLYSIYTDQNNSDRMLSILSKFYALCDLVLPQLTWKPMPHHDARIAKAMEILERDCCERFSMENVAVRCSMSSAHFHTLFKHETGCTPLEYKNRAAINVAKQLLRGDPTLSIEEITSLSGFETSSYFRRLFRRIVGKSPREYRKAAEEQMPF